MGQIFVKVRDKSVDDNGVPTLNNGIESVITYRAYGHTQEKFDLIYQCDESGRQVFGQNGQPNPNLGAQHRELVRQNAAAPAGNAGPTANEMKLQSEIEALKAMIQKMQTPSELSPNLEIESNPPVQEQAMTAPPQYEAVQQRRKPGPKPKLKEQVA